MVDVEHITAKDGKTRASIFLRGEVYYARFPVKRRDLADGKRYITETLRTGDLEIAKAQAHQRLREILEAEQDNRFLTRTTVAREIDDFIARYQESLSLGLSGHSLSMLRGFRKSVGRYWKEYVGTKLLSEVNYKDMAGYESWRQGYWVRERAKGKKLHGNARDIASRRTIEWEVNAFKQFLRAAVRDGKYSGTALEFTFSAGEDNRRSAFTLDQYRKLTNFMRKKEWLEEVGKHKNDSRLIRYRNMLRAYVLFMANTGLRIGEARKLKWSDVVFDKNNEGEDIVRVKVYPSNTKVRKRREVIGLDGAKNGLERLFAQRTADEDFCSPEDFIWSNENGKPIADFREGYNNLLRAAGVEHDSNGGKLTIYSLRHTYITFRLQHNVPIYEVATNCGTSVEMIEKFYSDAKSSDFVDTLTQRKRAVTADAH